MAKKCPPGKYYCFDDKKCKKIPRGYHIGARGYLARDDDNETKKNGNGNSNGNGNGGNGAGNGNGGSGGGANGNGGGMGEEVVYEKTMTPAQKRKDTMLKKKYDKSDMKKSMQKQYGKEEGKKVYFATIRKQAMEAVDGMKVQPSLPGLGGGGGGTDAITMKSKSKSFGKRLTDLRKILTYPISRRNIKVDPNMKFASEGRLASLEKASVLAMSDDPKDQDKAREIKTRFDYQSLRKQIADKKKSDTKESVEGVEDDKYNVSEEGLRAWFGKSSGTTKSGRKVKGWVQVGGKYDGKPCARQPGQKSTPKCVSSSKRRSMSKKERDSAARRKRAADPNQPQKSGAAKPTNVSTDPKKKMSENYFNEAKDKKGKGSGTKDACYHKVKSRYSVWPSAYASGALVKCRKVGAANWGNKSKNEGFSPMQVAALEAAGMIEIKEGKKCWKGYEKKGTQKLFGKTYNRCVKKEEVEQIDELSKTTTANYLYKAKVDKDYVHSGKMGKYAKARDKGMKRAEKKLGKKDSDRIKYVADYDARSMRQDSSKSEYPRKIKVKEGVEDTNLFPAGTQGKVKKVLDRGTKFMKQNPVGKVLSNIVKPVNNNKGSNYTSGGKVTNEGTSYGLYKGDGKPKGAMKDYLDKKKKKDDDKKKVVEAIQFLRRKKKESEEERKPKKAMDAGARLRRKKQRQEYAEKISGSEDNVPDDIRDHVELASESKIRLVKNGHTYRVILTWRGKTYMIQMFVPSVSKPTRKQVEKEVQKIYPDAKVLSFLPRELEPGEPTVMVGEEKEERDEYGDLVGGPKISKKEKKKNLAKNEKDEDHTTTTAESMDGLPGLGGGGGGTNAITDKAKTKSLGKRFKDVGKLMTRPLHKVEVDPRTKFASESVDGMKIPKVTGLGGGGGGTDAVTSKAKDRTLGGKIRNIPRLLSRPFVKPKPDPAEKFAEEYVTEDDMKGMSVKSGHKRPTKSGAGMTQKGVEAYRRRNPGSKLKTAVTGKVKKGSKDAKRRKSYCARSAGQMKKFPKAAKDPNSRLRQARKRWKC